MTTDRTIRSPQTTNTAERPIPSQNAALQGAALAFGKPAVKPKPNLNTYSGDDGALAAARGAGRRRGWSAASQQDQFRTPEKQMHSGGQQGSIAHHSTGGSVQMASPRSGAERRSPTRPQMGRLDGSGFLQPGNTPGMEARSPSFIAATLAASRSASLSPNVTGQKSGMEVRPQLNNRSPSTRRSSSKESSDNVLDTTSIPPTNRLIGMFEQKAPVETERMKPAVKRKDSERFVATTSAESKEVPQARSRTLSSPTPKQRAPIMSPKGPLPQPGGRTSTKTELTKPLSTIRSVNVPQLKPKPNVNLRSPDPSKTSASSIVKPAPPVARKIVKKNESTSSHESFASASDQRPAPAPRRDNPSPQRRQRLTSSSSLSVDSANLQINSMADAIVASSLASSRAASPAKQLLQPPPPPPSRRSARGMDHIFHHHKEASRTPSPNKQNGMRTTMRKPRLEPEVDEGDKRRTKKHNIMKKHPNKHHEGDRKRWRDSITELERKRYEAVWASNKGIHVFPQFPGSENLVCSLVVKDVFTRSRLHLDVLEELYALVDRRGDGYLEREEFVVGLWLIDQRLKGRKLPTRVSDHVWRSVGGLQGIKVRKAYNGK